MALNQRVRFTSPSGDAGARKHDGQATRYSLIGKGFDAASRAYLASSKSTVQYSKALVHSMERYERVKKHNLYAIVLPAGMGKSTLCKEYGCIDVDEVVTDASLLNELISERRRLVERMDPDWQEHNRKWYGYLRDAMSGMTFEKPQIIMVHTEEAAYELGAKPLTAVTSKTDMGLERREPIARTLGRLNREVVGRRTETVKVQTVSTWEQRDVIVRGVIVQVLECGAPLKWDKDHKHASTRCRGYAPMCPDWVKYGDFQTDALRIVEQLVESKQAPEAAIRYYQQMMFGSYGKEGARNQHEQWAALSFRIKKHCTKRPVQVNPAKEGFDWQKEYPSGSPMELAKRNVSLRALHQQMPLDQDEYGRMLLASHHGGKHTHVAAVMVYYYGIVRKLRDDLKMAVIESRILEVQGVSWIKLHKEMHAHIRYTGTFFGLTLSLEERCKLMYTHLLHCREVYEVDAAEEVEKRTKYGVWKQAFDGQGWSKDEFHRLMREAIRDSYRKLRSKPVPLYVDFLDYWKRRHEWVTKGSTVINKEINKTYPIEVLVDGVSKVWEKRHNKKSLSEDPGLLCRVIDEVVENTGINDTKGVPKPNEKRVLLPGNFYHYVVFSIVLQCFERGSEVGAAGLNAMSDDDFRNVEFKIRRGVEWFCYDYADFNAQHDTVDMRAVMQELLDSAPTNELMQWAINWVDIGMDKMEYVDPEGDRHRMVRGLYSGWRGTAWVNSDLNHAYHYVARTCYTRLYGKDLVGMFQGKGDDGISQVSDRQVAAEFYAVCDRIGFEAQTVKQLFGDTAEFLRVMYGGGEMFGSVCRTINSFISGSFEGEGGSFSERIKSRVASIELLRMRGMDVDVCNVLYHCVLSHFGRIKLEDEWSNVSQCVLHGRARDGGLGIPDSEGRLWKLSVRAPLPRAANWLVRLPNVNASQEWCEVMRKEFTSMGFSYTPTQRDVEEMAKDSYDVDKLIEDWGSQLDPDSWLTYWKHECEVTGYEKVERPEKSLELAHQLMHWINRDDKSALKNFGRVERYRAFESVLPSGWEREFGGDLDYSACSRLELRECDVRAPQHICTNAADWVRCLVLRREVNVRMAELMYTTVCYTMA